MLIRYTIMMLLILSGRGFIMDDDETIVAIERSLRSSGFAWSRLTPALVVALPSCHPTLVNETK